MKKGFTLIEMLAVLAILAILALLIVPIIGRQMNDAKEDLYNKQIETIKQGAINWGADHASDLPNVEDAFITITLKILKDGGYVSKKLKNPKTKKEFSDTLEIKITFKNKQYYYDVVDDSSITISDAELAQYKKKIDSIFNGQTYDKGKRDALRKELDALPGESRKYELLDYMDKKFEGLLIDGFKVELLDHSIWYSVGTVCRIHNTLPSSLQFEGTCEEMLKKYAVLVNAEVLTNLETAIDGKVSLLGSEVNINNYLHETYIPSLNSSGTLIADSHQYMRLLNSTDVRSIESAQYSYEVYFNNGDEILYNDTFPKWFVTTDNNRIQAIVGNEESDLLSLPFMFGNYGFSIRTIFLTTKENILKTVS